MNTGITHKKMESQFKFQKTVKPKDDTNFTLTEMYKLIELIAGDKEGHLIVVDKEGSLKECVPNLIASAYTKYKIPIAGNTLYIKSDEIE